MYTEQLNAYCARHNLEVVKEYTTMGEVRSHARAIARDKTTGERFYLYYDESRRRRRLDRQKRDYDIWLAGGIPEMPPCRGWRNTTLENRRSIESTNRRHTGDM